MSENKLIPTAKPKEIYVSSVYPSARLYHIAYAANEKREWKTRCGRTLQHTHKSLVPVSQASLCPRCATSQEYTAFNFYLGECWTIRQRKQREEKIRQQIETDERRTALQELAKDIVGILSIHIEEVSEPEHLPDASRIKCKTSIDGHTFKFTVNIPL